MAKHVLNLTHIMYLLTSIIYHKRNICFSSFGLKVALKNLVFHSTPSSKPILTLLDNFFLAFQEPHLTSPSTHFLLKTNLGQVAKLSSSVMC